MIEETGSSVREGVEVAHLEAEEPGDGRTVLLCDLFHVEEVEMVASFGRVRQEDVEEEDEDVELEVKEELGAQRLCCVPSLPLLEADCWLARA